MRQLVIVGLGGFIGAILRYTVSGWIQKAARTGMFPLGTMGVNLIGCLCIGFIGGLADQRECFTPEIRMFLLIGILGSFTTFSTFGYESLALIRDQQILSMSVNVIGHVGLGIFAAWAGYTIAQTI
ncbi:fluoride efflux transporter CrcB [bacterium]|nr:fluoride efflux transporter CrcB [bacterium]